MQNAFDKMSEETNSLKDGLQVDVTFLFRNLIQLNDLVVGSLSVSIDAVVDRAFSCHRFYLL